MKEWREGQKGDFCLLLLPASDKIATLTAWQEALQAHFGGRLVQPVHLTCDRFELAENNNLPSLLADLRRLFAPIRPLHLTAVSLRTIPTSFRGHILKWELAGDGRLPTLINQLTQLLTNYNARLFYAPLKQPGLVTALADIERTDTAEWPSRWPRHLFTAAHVLLSRIDQPGQFTILDEFDLTGYQLRRAQTADYQFLYNLHRATIQEYVAEIWGWDEAWQQAHFQEKFDPAMCEIIQFDGRDVGTLQLEERADELFLALIEILPEYQGRGIGAAVIQDILVQAEQRDVSVTLRVLRNNPARALYERLGFTIIDRSDTHLYMKTDERRMTNNEIGRRSFVIRRQEKSC
jgi:ribosomal protein S18 acetylase RimI-like enzyme